MARPIITKEETQVIKMPKKKLKVKRFIFMLLGLTYMGMFIYAFFGQPIKTYIVKYGKIEELDNSVGYIIKKEEVVGNNFPLDLIKPVKEEGQRVAKNSVIAVAFKSSIEEFEKKIADIDEKIQKAIIEQQKSNLGMLVFSDDIRKLDQDIEQKVIELCSAINQNKFTKIIELKTEINDDLKKRAEIRGEFSPGNQYIKSLIEEKRIYENKISNLKNEIKASIAGIVSYNIDGLENILKPDCISSLTVKQLAEIDSILNNNLSNNSNGIKVVDNFECFIATVLANQKKDRVIKEGQRVWLRFLGSESELTPAYVVRVSHEDGKVLVIFKINEKVESLLNQRKVSLDIVWSSYYGLKVPVSCLVKKDGKIGVMAVKANYTKFLEVDVIAQNEKFAILKEAAGIWDKGISLYEEIVLNGSNVEEGEQIRKWNF